MANMSYCRFRNTLGDLRECYEELTHGDKDRLSDEEKKARDRLINLCKDIVDDFGDDVD